MVKPLVLLKESLDKSVKVTLVDSSTLTGKLTHFSEGLSLVLDGKTVIRGSGIVYIQIL